MSHRRHAWDWGGSEAWRDWMGPRGFFRGGAGRRMDRGDVKLLILTVLQDGPKHGYEIIKEIEKRSQGAYAPSAGVVYPTLQMLEDMGYVRSRQQEERRVYEITDAGRAYLVEHQAAAGEAWGRSASWDWRELFGNEDQRELQRELIHFARTFLGSGHIFRASPQQLKEVREALEQARLKIEAILNV